MKRAPSTLRRLALAAALVLLAPGLRAADAPTLAPKDEPVYLYTALPGDTLIGLGKRLLADPTRWSELAKANTLLDPDRIGTGAQLRIPLRLMRSTPVPATLLSVTGRVQGGPSAGGADALQAGQTVPEGGTVSTGPDGHVSIRLVDGTLLRLRPDSRLQLRESRELKDAGVVRSGARLERGRVEVEAAPAKPGRAGFSIDTPQGVLGVRGTEFRVAVGAVAGAEDTGPPSTRGEVLGGVVAVEGRTGGQRVAAGYGSVVDAQGGVTPPVALLPPPDTSSLPVLQDSLPLRFVVPAVAGATRYRGQLASDERFDRVLAEQISATPELRYTDLPEAALPDGEYVLRLRAIDALGLEGRDADHRFRLKRAPPPPPPPPPAPPVVNVPPPPPPPPVRESCLRDNHGACVRGSEATLNLVP